MDEIDEIKSRINIKQYIQGIYNLGKETKSSGGYLYKNCPICNSTSEKNGDAGHFFINESTQSYSSFSSGCGAKGGSIIDFIMEYYNLGLAEAIKKAKQIAGITNNNYIAKTNTEAGEKKMQQTEQQKELEKQEFIRQQKKQFVLNGIAGINAESMQKVCNYMQTRGINKETVVKYNMFYSNNVYEDHNTGIERVVIPVYKNGEPVSYVARAMQDVEGKLKAVNSAGEQTPLNIDYLKQEPGKEKCIYICEGWADALSLEQEGKKAIALHSTNQTKKLYEAIENNNKTASKYIYILCFDNDSAGRKTTEEVKKTLEEKKIQTILQEIPQEYKDVNEWYCSTEDKEQFRKGITPFNKEDTQEYIDNFFLNDIEKMKLYRGRGTGFKTLDEELNGIRPGLYVIGAISSLGKTTLITQIADQMAEKGEHIIIFSLEQSRFELVAKSISRETFKIDPPQALTGLAIMQNTNVQEITLRAVRNYENKAKNIIIKEGNFNTTVKTIRDYVSNYINATGTLPIVVVDYLQILKPLNEKMTDKQAVDYNVTELKKMSRDFDIPVFTICSFNRENYTTTVDFASFKESGAIEYSADVVMGLQLQVMEEIQNTSNNKISEIREKINNAKNENPRRVQLVCLKNRSGKSYFKCEFKYYPQFNYFEEAGLFTTIGNRKRIAKDDWERTLPF